ncbi:MAG: preprotein translocase subunit SecG [Bacteroidales bacterium]|nr:preprotein translocase subunit SecG [Bacteroidales bacterium]
MYTALIVLIVIAAVLLVLIVLAQNSKGGGLASNLAGGAQYGAVAEQKSKLENYTWGLVIAIAVLSIIASISGGNRTVSSDDQSDLKNRLINQSGVQYNTTPAEPAADFVPEN